MGANHCIGCKYLRKNIQSVCCFFVKGLSSSNPAIEHGQREKGQRPCWLLIIRRILLIVCLATPIYVFTRLAFYLFVFVDYFLFFFQTFSWLSLWPHLHCFWTLFVCYLLMATFFRFPWCHQKPSWFLAKQKTVACGKWKHPRCQKKGKCGINTL